MINSPDSKVLRNFPKLLKYSENKTHLIHLICNIISSNY